MAVTPSAAPIRVAVVGWGAIARAEHAPALGATAAFAIAGVVTLDDAEVPFPRFGSLAALLDSGDALDAVAVCTPPGPRFAIAREALSRGLHVLLEKPPAATVREARFLEAMARDAGRTLFASWHSREAAAVASARAWLAGQRIRRIRIDWREDVEKWHPGQDWIWAPAGLGVFDPGINALSILTHILPTEVHVQAADLLVPVGKETPIAARLSLTTADGGVGEAHFDWRETGAEVWTIAVETDDGRLTLLDGGARLVLDDAAVGGRAATALGGEYPRLYARFAELIRAGASDVDLRPLELVADAFLRGRRVSAEAFG